LRGQHMARLLSSGRKNRSVRMLHTEKLKLEENLQKKYFSQNLASEHTYIIN
jgi:hypothetical protein